MEIRGYKAFNADKTNRYGKSFEEGEHYHEDGPISFGNHGHGYHMCTHLSDVFRYFEPDNITVASVIGSGEFDEEEDESWMEPYYGLYAVSDIYIEKFLTRDEIIEIMENAFDSDKVKFFATAKPTEEEGIRLLRSSRDRISYDKMVAAFLYYIKGVNVYGLYKNEKMKVLKKVLNDGQDSNKGSKGE